MSVLATLIIALIAVAAGFVGGKLYTEKTMKHDELKQQLDDSAQQMNQYKSEVSTHLNVTQNLMDEMKTNYDNIVAQLAKTTKLLEAPKPTLDQNISYFANETTAQLLSASINSELDKRDAKQTIQPFDYTEESSGLFREGTQTKKPQTEEV
ncbi:MAG: uncharacterized membrane-anchored protein YhcB (DUF1043 family) [Phenylobacterium sp.]|jgi:uncharacterized membrane-anchored protein YhcB (DUF1043 family)